jgi:hypothetical protein
MSAPSITGWRDYLAEVGVELHPAAELFPMLSEVELDELARDIDANGLTSPLALWRPTGDAPFQLLDGRNRVAAMWRFCDGADRIAGAISLANRYEARTDPVAFIISANLKRRHLSADQKREIAAALLKADPSKSDRRVAAESGLNRTDVGVERRKLEHKGDVSISDTRTDTQGRQQPATRPPSKLAQIRELRERGAPSVVAPVPKAAVVDNTAATVLLASQIEDFRATLKARRAEVERIDRSLRLQLARGLMVALGIAPSELADAPVDGGAK